MKDTIYFRNEGESMQGDGLYITYPANGRLHMVVRYTDKDMAVHHFKIAIPQDNPKELDKFAFEHDHVIFPRY